MTSRKKSFVADIIQRLAHSPSAEEREALFIGFDEDRVRTPVLFPDASWKEGLWILGAAHSGKSSRAAAPFGAQRIRRNDCPVFIIDLKGDDVLFHTMRLEAERLDRRFDNDHITPAGIDH